MSALYAALQDADSCSDHVRDQPESGVPQEPLGSTSSQFEDADDEWMAHDQGLPEHGHWLPPPGDDPPDNPVDSDMTAEEYSTLDGCGTESQFVDWTPGEQNMFPGTNNSSSEQNMFPGTNNSSSDIATDNGGWYSESPGQGVDSMHSHGSDAYDQLNAPEGVDSSSDGQWTDMQDSMAGHSINEMQNSAEQIFSEELDTSEGHSFCKGDNLSSEDNPTNGQGLTDVDSAQVEDVDNAQEEPDDSLALVPYVSPSVSASTTPSPPPFAPGPSVVFNMAAAAATGVPLHPNPLGMGQPRFVRIHPLHIAAAVAAQRSRAAAAAVHQQTQMAAAAAAVHQQAQNRLAAAAAVQQQQAHNRMAAMARQQRTQAAMMHQQLVRSRYMGAPVLVRQPFMPVPRVAAPMR